MKTIDSTAYSIIKDLGNQVKDLSLDKSFGVYDNPYVEKQLDTYDDIDTTGLVMYKPEDIAFCNTQEFTKTGKYFIKNGVYTTLNPTYDKAEYKAFWDKEEERCKQGMTLPGKLIKKEDGTFGLQEVHITGEHYGYLNFAEIKRSKSFDTNKGVLVSPTGEQIAKVNKTKGGTKGFSLPDFWDGDYYYFKALELCRKIGKHLVIGKARRKGYSYKNGWVAANRANLFPRTTTVVGAYDLDSLTDDGTMNKVKNFLDHINKHTDWNKRRLNNTLENLRIGYRYKGDPVDRGFLSQILTAVFRGNPGAARGKDGDLIFIEEAGKCSNLAEVIPVTLKTLSDGVLTTGLMVVFGTGGGDDKYWEGFEHLFYNTYSNKFISFENIWDDDLKGTSCGFFHSALMNKPGLIDLHGNSDVKGAYKFEEEERRLKANKPTELNAHCMEEPYSPSEAFSRVTDSMMPTAEIDAQLRRVKNDPTLKGLGREGLFIETSKGIKFVDRNTANDFVKDQIKPQVVDYPLKKETEVEGCWVMWEQPYRDPKTGKIPDNLYRVWNDPFGIDKSKKHFSIKDSLAGTYLYEVANNFTPTRGDRIIGAFHGRREDGSDYNKQMFLGALYCNAKVLYENDRGSVFTDAKALGLLDILVDEPDFTYQKDLQRGGKGRKKGISIGGNSNRKANGAIYLKEWLLMPRGTDANGKKLLNLHYFYCIGGLKELLKYDGKRNTDRASTLIVGMFDIKEMQWQGKVPDKDENRIEDDYFTEFGAIEESDIYSREQVQDDFLTNLGLN